MKFTNKALNQLKKDEVNMTKNIKQIANTKNNANDTTLKPKV